MQQDQVCLIARLIGHIHAARFEHDDHLDFVNTGTWI